MSHHLCWVIASRALDACTNKSEYILFQDLNYVFSSPGRCLCLLEIASIVSENLMESEQ